jgi:alpha-galactosidase
MKTWRIDTPSQTIVLAQKEGHLPFVCYWDLALPHTENLTDLAKSTQPDIIGGMLDDLPLVTLSPQAGSTFQGQLGSTFRTRDGQNLFPNFSEIFVEVDAHKLLIHCTNTAQNIAMSFEIIAHVDTDMFELKTTAQSTRPIFIDWLAAPVLPATQHSDHTLEVSGRWCGEFQFNKNPWTAGARLRETLSGRTGHETFPGLILPELGTTNSQGGCFGFHYGWSGGHKMITEELSDGRRQVQFGHATDAHCELTTHKETAPLFVTYSPNGLNGIARNFQHHARTHILPLSAQDRPRLVHYNCWEAVYFDLQIDELKEIATRAKELGAERFVLDDGWFGSATKGRDDDTSSLGDWDVDVVKFPNGLTPLIDHIIESGMAFGLWFEPEMVNPDSALYRAHPEWALGAPDQLLGRHQMVLDLTNPDVRDYLFSKIDAVLSAHNITYVKWDHNRVLPYPLSAQTDGFYELLQRLRTSNPNVEFESCSSGGGRIDFGALKQNQRVWLSDSNDGIERWKMQHNAAMWLPSDVVGSHVGPRHCHTSGRILPMSFRAYVAASRHMGFEMDPRELTDDEAAILTDITTWYRKNRPWMHSGFVVRLDSSDDSQLAEITISKSGDKFTAFIGQLTPPNQILARPLRLTGLNPDAHYQITLRNPEDACKTSRGDVALRDGPLTLSGRILMQQGVQLPAIFPSTMLVVEGQRIE